MPRRLEVVKSLSFVRALRWVMWALLALSVVLTVLGPPPWLTARIESGAWPRAVLLAPTALFGVFLVAFAIYRFSLVRAGRYNAAKMFLQVGLGVLVLLFMVRPSLERYRGAAHAATEQVDLGPLLTSPDPVARVAACEALAHRPKTDAARAGARRLATSDPDPRVRAACRRVR